MKKTPFLVLALVLALTLAACGGDTTPTPSGNNDPASTQNENPTPNTPGNGDTTPPDTGNPGNTPLLEGKTFADLSNMGKLEVSALEIENYQLYTNSTRITVSIPRGEYSGTFLLYNSQDTSDFIMSFDLDQSNRSRTFTALTASYNYYIVANVSDNSVIVTVSD